uniref:Protein Wnt n=1 Tax=Trichuris muris TaxID=70415 RepID=A0A5S6QEQ8_TRIMR
MRATVTLCLLLLAKLCPANWWLLATPTAYQFTLQFSTDYKDKCRKMHYLVARQRELCQISQNMLAIVSKGAQMGLKECQTQFAGRLWNCSTFFDTSIANMPLATISQVDFSVIGRSNKSGQSKQGKLRKSVEVMMSDAPARQFHDVSDVFGGILKLHSREKAYVHAISAAGVAYSITRACSQGDLPSCSCDKDVHRRNFKNKRFHGDWEWGGCSEDVNFGERLTKDFVDSNELARSWNDPAPKLMNLHNNEAGRRAIRANMKLMCKCHGVSGSCTVRLCWRRMADFHTIGQSLSEKFDGAVKVKFSGMRHKLKPYVVGLKKPTKRDLVYLQQSPDFCQEDAKLSIYGTKGRQCERDGYGTNGCAMLCCGRGYTTVVAEEVRDCKCKFQWCCEVKCEKCKYVMEADRLKMPRRKLHSAPAITGLAKKHRRSSSAPSYEYEPAADRKASAGNIPLLKRNLSGSRRGSAQAGEPAVKIEDGEQERRRSSPSAPLRRKTVIGAEPSTVAFISATPLPEAFGDIESVGTNVGQSPRQSNCRYPCKEETGNQSKGTPRKQCGAKGSSFFTCILLLALFAFGVVAAMHFSGLLKSRKG